MHILIKWYYWYKNLWDELIIFSLLNRANERFNPNKISIECWNKDWLKNRIIRHKDFLVPWIIEKLNFLPKPNRKEKIKICLWMKRKLYDFIILWWWEVIDESRDFLYRWWNLFLQYRRSIKKWITAIIGWLWTNKKLWTSFLQNFFIKNANIIILRDQNSFKLTKKILEQNWQNRKEKSEYGWDLTLSLLEEAKEIFSEKKIKSNRYPYYLINCSPLCDGKKCFKLIKKFVDYYKDLQPIYVACNTYEDEKFFKDIQKILPNCEKFNRTQTNITETLKLFYFAEGGIWARLHFLYILKFFKKKFIQLHNSHKIQVNLSDLDNNNA